MARMLSGRALLAVLVVLPTVAAWNAAPASAAGGPSSVVYDDEPVDREIELARLGYQNGVRVVFSRDAESGDWGIRQDGAMGRNAPLAYDDKQGILKTYLTITPRSVPVPRELLSEPPAGTPTPPELANRTIAASVVVAEQISPCRRRVDGRGGDDDLLGSVLELVQLGRAARLPKPGLGVAPVEDVLLVRLRRDEDVLLQLPRQLRRGYARHRIYYKSAGDYYKHHDYEVAADHWQAVKKGSVHRYRKVSYDSAAGDTRNGKYTG